jgi:hypothetical protein
MAIALTVLSYEVDPVHDIRLVRKYQRDGGSLWAVTKENNSMCLNRQGEWEDEPMPSARDDAYLERCRFGTAEAALDTFRKWLGADV